MNLGRAVEEKEHFDFRTPLFNNWSPFLFLFIWIIIFFTRIIHLNLLHQTLMCEKSEPTKGNMVIPMVETRKENRYLEDDRFDYLRSWETSHWPAKRPLDIFLQQGILLLKAIPIFKTEDHVNIICPTEAWINILRFDKLKITVTRALQQQLQDCWKPVLQRISCSLGLAHRPECKHHKWPKTMRERGRVSILLMKL